LSTSFTLDTPDVKSSSFPLEIPNSTSKEWRLVGYPRQLQPTFYTYAASDQLFSTAECFYKPSPGSDPPLSPILSHVPTLATATLSIPPLSWSDWQAAYISIATGLSKFRLTSLVVTTALAGYALAAATPFASEAFINNPLTTGLFLALGTGLTSAAANTINQVGKRS
ncbi:unnamed protein product, partial [Protopolystoma xenopodis]